MSGAPPAKRQRTNAMAKAAVPVDFDCYLRSVAHILNVKYRRLSSSKQFEKGFDAAEEVQECIKAIRKATPAHSIFGTKKDALVTLLGIGSCVTEGGGELGREVRKVFQYETCLETTMLRIVRSMTALERNGLVTQGFADDLVNFEREAGGYCIFERMEEVRKALLSKKEIVRKENEDEEDESDEDNEKEVDENENQDDTKETQEVAEEGSESEDEDSSGED